MAERSQFFWLFFRFSGRIGRAAYFLGGLLLAIAQAFLLYRFTLVPETSPAGQFWQSLFWLTVLVSVWCYVALAVKRLHDLGRPGILAASLFVPVISIIAFIALCLIPGEPAANRYGGPNDAPWRD